MTALRVLLLTAALACRIVTIAKSGGPTRSQLRNTVPEHEQESRAERRHKNGIIRYSLRYLLTSGMLKFVR